MASPAGPTLSQKAVKAIKAHDLIWEASKRISRHAGMQALESFELVRARKARVRYLFRFGFNTTLIFRY